MSPEANVMIMVEHFGADYPEEDDTGDAFSDLSAEDFRRAVAYRDEDEMLARMARG